MKNSIIVLLAALLTSCGANLAPKVFSIPSELQAYVTTFEGVIGRPVVNIQYRFQDLGYTDEAGGAIGQCELPDAIVTLDPLFWSEATDLDKELVVLHELGHCVLYRGHLNTTQANGFDVSIMNAYLMPDRDFAADPGYYFGELRDTSGVPMIGSSGSGGEHTDRCTRPPKAK